MAADNILTNTFYYSPSVDVCYPGFLYESYKDSGTWPADGVSISEAVHIEFFLNSPPDGKRRHWNSTTKTFSWEVVPAYVYSDIEKQEVGRRLRNNFVFATDVMMLSDYTMNDTLLTDKQKQDVANTRIAFKIWPTNDNWWNTPLPTVPQWIIDDATKNRKYHHPTSNEWPLPPFTS
jgi:hypothetical protein